jgi:hypothetical protein
MVTRTPRRTNQFEGPMFVLRIQSTRDNGIYPFVFPGLICIPLEVAPNDQHACLASTAACETSRNVRQALFHVQDVLNATGTSRELLHGNHSELTSSPGILDNSPTGALANTGTRNSATCYDYKWIGDYDVWLSCANSAPAFSRSIDPFATFGAHFSISFILLAYVT